MEPELDKAFVLKIDNGASRDKVQDPPSEVQSVIGTEAPPWAESYEISSENEGISIETSVSLDSTLR